MEIYKRGQGVYARGLALVIFLLFLVWACYEIYRFPSAANIVIRTGVILDGDSMSSLKESGFKEIRVRGLANHPVNETLVEKKASGVVQKEGGERIALIGEKYTKAMVKSLEEAKIRFVPVEGHEDVAVTDLLPGMILKNNVIVPRSLRLEDLPLGVALTEKDAAKIRGTNEDRGGFTLRNVYENLEAYKARDTAKLKPLLNSKKVVAGMVLTEVPQYTRIDECATAGVPLSAETIQKLKGLTAEGPQFRSHKVEDKGFIKFAEVGSAVEGRYLLADQIKQVETWLTRELFIVPLVKLEVSIILLIAIGVFILAGLAILYTWNWKRWNDLLIETQLEMKKVSWPKKQELINSSVIVIVMTFFLGFFLWFIDLLLTFLSKESGLYAG